MSGEADFGVFQTEEISYATQWNDYLSITNEIRSFEKGRLLTVYYIHNNICMSVHILNILNIIHFYPTMVSQNIYYMRLNRCL